MPAYFERQELARCAVHAANNLLQRRAYDAAYFDEIASSLSPTSFFGIRNPHRTLLLGDYDANVLLAALCGEGSGLNFRWTDVRAARELLTVSRFPVSPRLVGFIANRESSGLLGWALRSRHWLAVREVAGEGWLELDSLAHAPQPLAGLAGALERLVAFVAAGGQVIEFWEGEPPSYIGAAI